MYFFTNFNLLFFFFCKIQVGLTITHIYFSIPDKQIYMKPWFEYPSLWDLTTSEHRPLYAHEPRSSAVPFVSLQSVCVGTTLEPWPNLWAAWRSLFCISVLQNRKNSIAANKHIKAIFPIKVCAQCIYSSKWKYLPLLLGDCHATQSHSVQRKASQSEARLSAGKDRAGKGCNYRRSVVRISCYQVLI